eukprot:scaffold117669_cov33-Tisochrysis_lutea.AAC.1
MGGINEAGDVTKRGRCENRGNSYAHRFDTIERADLHIVYPDGWKRRTGRLTHCNTPSAVCAILRRAHPTTSARIDAETSPNLLVWLDGSHFSTSTSHATGSRPNLRCAAASGSSAARRKRPAHLALAYPNRAMHELSYRWRERRAPGGRSRSRGTARHPSPALSVSAEGTGRRCSGVDSPFDSHIRKPHSRFASGGRTAGEKERERAASKPSIPPLEICEAYPTYFSNVRIILL